MSFLLYQILIESNVLVFNIEEEMDKREKAADNMVVIAKVKAFLEINEYKFIWFKIKRYYPYPF